MKATKFILAILLVGTSLFNQGCKKEKGEKGDTGIAGVDGNANVHSETYSVTWAYSSTNVLYYAIIGDSYITADVLTNGAVLVYAVDIFGGNAIQLPFTYAPSSTYTESIITIVNVGTVEIQIQDSDLTAPAFPSSNTFKVVTMTGRAMRDNPNLNLKDYNAVKKAFNLRD